MNIEEQFQPIQTIYNNATRTLQQPQYESPSKYLRVIFYKNKHIFEAIKSLLDVRIDLAFHFQMTMTPKLNLSEQSVNGRESNSNQSRKLE